ncbi:MAG TPA: GGDEF domain-containing protein [Polyangiaceae bacterium]|nr:GGDEF domain-containing protein [Polyangiaceae bacterium]
MPPAPSQAAEPLRVAAAIAVVLLVGWIDWKTDNDVSLSLFYLVPVAAAARFCRFSSAIGISIIAGAAWFAADLAVRRESEMLISVWNSATRLVLFVALAWLVAVLKQERDRLRQIARRLEGALAREQRLARTDALTGLPNSRAFLDALRREVARSERDARVLAVAYIDIDNFKLVNDEYGHAEGDELLRKLAQALVECIRAGDVPGRLGGDEFAVLFIDISPESAERVAQRYLERVAQIAEQYPGSQLGASVGIVASRGSLADAEALLTAADAAMYEAKAAGKGSIRVKPLVANLGLG